MTRFAARQPGFEEPEPLTRGVCSDLVLAPEGAHPLLRKTRTRFSRRRKQKSPGGDTGQGLARRNWKAAPAFQLAMEGYVSNAPNTRRMLQACTGSSRLASKPRAVSKRGIAALESQYCSECDCIGARILFREVSLSSVFCGLFYSRVKELAVTAVLEPASG